MRLSAYSTTTIAPSTSIPTAKIRPNITMFEIVMPMTPSKTKHKRKDVGIENPTSNAARVPSEVKTTIITKATAVKTDPSSWLTMLSTERLWSLDVPKFTADFKSSGQLACSSSTTRRTSFAVSIRLNPLRLTT